MIASIASLSRYISENGLTRTVFIAFLVAVLFLLLKGYFRRR